MYCSESLTDTGEAAARSRGLQENDGRYRRQRCREREELRQRLQHRERLRARFFRVERYHLVRPIAKICGSLYESGREWAVPHAYPKSGQTSQKISGSYSIQLSSISKNIIKKRISDLFDNLCFKIV